MIITIFFLLLGFILLIKGADFFVNGASSFGIKLKIPQIIIGLTVVAFGTSLPEFFINIIASSTGKNDIVLGNIIGSNIFNILMILGLSAAISPITSPKNTTWKEIPFVILVTLILSTLCLDSFFGGSISILSRGDGLILIIFLGYFLSYLLKLAKSSPPEETSIEQMPGLKIAIFILLGIGGLIIGGNMVVDASVKIAKAFHVSDKLIALTIISIGTGLPELVTSIVAATKKNSGIALGNIVGSNIFNILLVLGVSSIIHPIVINPVLYSIDFGVLIASAVMLFITMVIFKKSTISRIEGICMIGLYSVYLGYNIIFR